jgi:hypothetical protein
MEMRLANMLMIGALSAALIAVGPHEGRVQELISIDGVTLIDNFLGFRAGEVHEYSEQRLGASIPYYRDDAVLTVYIYDNDIEPFPRLITEDTAVDQFYQIAEEVFAMQELKEYADVELISEFSLDDNAGNVDFLCSMFSLRMSEWKTTGKSVVCLAVSGRNFLKIRLSSDSLSDEEFMILALSVTSKFAISAGI